MEKTLIYKLLFALLIICLITFGCKEKAEVLEQPFVQVYTFNDSRDSNVYNYVKIGDQFWMAENLRFKPDSGQYILYNNEDYFLNDYGYLYDWNNACKVCPSGWHLPSRTELNELIGFLGGEELAFGKLKEVGTNHWVYPNSGATNEVGFSGLPGGIHNFYENYSHSMGQIACFWTTQIAGTHSSIILMLRNDYYGGLGQIGLDDVGCSVRCLKDN